MSDATNDLQQQLIQQLKALQPTTSNANPWQQTQNTGKPEPTGIAVPIKVDGVRVYLQFGAAHAQSPQAIIALIQALDDMGAPVDRWKPRQQWGGGNNYNSNRKW